MLEIIISIALVAATSFILSRYAKLGTIIGITIGSVAVAAMRVIPNVGPVADTADLLGTIGLLLIMFLAGNSFDTKGLLGKAKPWYLIGGQMIIMTLIGAVLGRALGNPLWTGAFVIGFTLMQSSTGIVLDALKKRRWEDEPVGVLSVTLMVIQDIASGSMPIVIGILAGSQEGGINIAWVSVLLLILLFLYVAGPRIGKELLGHRRSPEESVFMMGLVTVLGVAYVAELAGIASASAAFLAGIVWRKTGFINKTESQLGLVRDLLIPIFFIASLRSADLSMASFLSIQTWAFVVVEMLATLVVTYPLARIAGIGPMGSGLLSFSSAQVGEFTFLVVLLGTRAGLLSPTEGGALAFASVITFTVSAIGADFFEPIFEKIKPFIKVFDPAVMGKEVTVRKSLPSSVIFLDIPEGNDKDVESAITPWIAKAKKSWPKTSVLVVESTQDPEEEKFIKSLGVDLIVQEPYLDPVSILEKIGLKKLKVVVSGPALGLRQDLHLAEFLKNYPKVKLVTVASNRVEADQLEKLAENNEMLIVINETRNLARNLGKLAA